jgi:hypothetical protein
MWGKGLSCSEIVGWKTNLKCKKWLIITKRSVLGTALIVTINSSCQKLPIQSER